MKPNLLLRRATAALLLFTLWPAWADTALTALGPEALFERAAPSVWVVRTQDGNGRPLMQGSAVVIGPGRLISNCHVLRQAKTVAVARDNVSYGAALEHPDTERDLCTLRVANFHAPAADIGPDEGLRVGAKVYAIGAPRGLETTISDGLLSGIRRNAQDAIEALQVSVPISPGSSGGGLFDAQGRLIGITTSGLRDSQNLNFALPASWISEVPARAQAALTARETSKATVTAAPPAAERVLVYRLRDRLTGTNRSVIRRLDAANEGVVQDAGEFDLGMPSGGWITEAPEVGTSWRLDYTVKRQEVTVGMQLRARAVDASTVRIGEREYAAVRVNFTGYTRRRLPAMDASGTYNAVAWYAPTLKRIVRFEVDAPLRQGSSSYARIDEILELVEIRSE